MIKIGLFDFFKKKPQNTHFAPYIDGYTPIYTQFGTNIYLSDVVQQCLACIADEIKKLIPTHVRYKGADPTPVAGDMQGVLDNPNELMTTSEFLEKITYLLLMNDNVFIIPVYKTWRDKKTGEERRKYEKLYPINPANVYFIQDSSGTLYVQFIFRNGYETTIPYSDVIHVRYRYAVSEYMGGDQFGQPDNAALLKTLDLNHKILQGIAKSLQASYTVNGTLKINGMLDKQKADNAIREFNERLANNESGILPLDMKIAEYTPIEHKGDIVDEKVLQFIDSKILRNWRISLPILTGDYTKEQYEAFYSSGLEGIILSISQAFTKKLFTDRERSFGNKIELYPKELIFMSVEQTIRMIEIMSPTGGLFENEKRVALGLRPLPELEGVRYMSLNWINAENADQYQVGKVNVDVLDEEKTID